VQSVNFLNNSNWYVHVGINCGPFAASVQL
jgi:hypothetical protein